MKIFFQIALVMLTSSQLMAQQDVTLKLSYNNQAVCNYEITIKHGDAAIGKTTSNDQGEALFSGVPLLSKSIDVYGYKKTASGEKTFDMKGYVTLNDDYFAHIKMEELVKEMASGSGMPESMFAGAWGLTELDCAGKTVASGNNNEPQQNETSETSDIAPVGTTLPTKEEALAMQEQGYKNEIAALDKKIAKQETRVNELKVAGATVPEVEKESLELEEMKLKRERKKLNLEKVQKQQHAELTVEEKESYKAREQKLNDQEDAAKDKRKAIEKDEKVLKEKEGGETTTGERAKEKLDNGALKLKMGSLRTQIKMKENALVNVKEKGKITPEEIAEKEKEIADLKADLAEVEKQAEQK